MSRKDSWLERTLIVVSSDKGWILMLSGPAADPDDDADGNGDDTDDRDDRSCMEAPGVCRDCDDKDDDGGDLFRNRSPAILVSCISL